jgi:hypothetical protein
MSSILHECFDFLVWKWFVKRSRIFFHSILYCVSVFMCFLIYSFMSLTVGSQAAGQVLYISQIAELITVHSLQILRKQDRVLSMSHDSWNGNPSSIHGARRGSVLIPWRRVIWNSETSTFDIQLGIHLE